MLNDIKLLLGSAAANYSDELIDLIINQTMEEIQLYCNRPISYDMEAIVVQIVIIRLNRLNTEGLSNQSFSGVSESFIDGYPKEILDILNRKRKIKTL